MRIGLIFLFLFCFNVICFSQSEADTIAVEDYFERTPTKEILTDRIHIISNKDEITKRLEWKWECQGPNIQPKEFNPGGRALPEYSVGRGNGTGRINYLHQHRKKLNVLWACSPTGGLWQSFDKGNTWVIAGTDQLPISGTSSVASHKRKTNTWWIATGDGDDVFQYSDGVWFTQDGGVTYTQVNGEQDGEKIPFGSVGDFGGQISEVKSDLRKRNRIYAATNRGFYKAENANDKGEVRWEKIHDGQFYEIQMRKGSSRQEDIIVASGESILLSLNSGKSWQKVSLPSRPELERFGFIRIKTLLHKDWPSSFFAVITCTEQTAQRAQGEAMLYEYDWSQDKWTFIRSLKKEMNNMIPTRARAIAVDPKSSQNILCANVQPIFYSNDQGRSFNRVDRNQMHDDCHHIIYSKDGSTIWASHDGGVSRSEDGGKTWKASDEGIGAANIFGLATAQTSEPSFVFGAYDTGGNVLWDSTWWHVSWGDGFEAIAHPQDHKIMFTTMQNGSILRSIDGTSFDTGRSPSGAKTEWHTWIKMHPTNHDLVFCAGERLMRSTDLGNSWQIIFDVKKVDSNLLNAYRFFLSEEHPGVMYLYVLNDTKIQPQIWRTFNVTANNPDEIVWEKIETIPTEGWIMSIVVDPLDPHQFFVLYGHQEIAGKCWFFDGKNYIDVTANLGRSKCESMVLQKGPEKRIYIGSNYGVFTKRENESQWTLLQGLPGTQIKSIDINYKAGKLVVGTFGRGVWWGDLLKR